jgi:hypothetical protein
VHRSKFASFQRQENADLGSSFGTLKKVLYLPARCVSFHILERCAFTNSELKY